MFRQKWLLRTVVMGWAASFAGTAAAADTVVRQFSIGTTSTTVGIAAAGEDVELTGPQALTSDAQGNLFVLDQINGRILRFNPKQPAGDPGVLKMPADVQANDLVVRKSDILVWDGSIRTLKAANEPSTRGIDDDVVQLEEVVTRDVDDQFAISAFAQMGSQPPGSAADLLDQNTRAAVIKKTRQPDRQYIASRGKGSVIADIIPNKGDNSVRIEVQTMDSNETIAQLSLRVPNRLGTVEFLEIDNSDRFYVLGENVPESGRQSSTFVARYASNGKLEGIYELPLENTPLTRRFVTISGDGDVYFLRTKADAVDVVGVGFRPLRNASVIDLRLPRTASRNLPGGQFDGRFDAVAAVRPSNRQQTIETAFAFEGRAMEADAGKLRSRSGCCLHRLQSDSPPLVSAGQGQSGGPRRALLLGLPWFAGKFPPSRRGRNHGRKRLHAQRSARRCCRRGLFRFRERGVGTVGPLHDRRHSGDRQEGGKSLGFEAG